MLIQIATRIQILIYEFDHEETSFLANKGLVFYMMMLLGLKNIGAFYQDS